MNANAAGHRAAGAGRHAPAVVLRWVATLLALLGAALLVLGSCSSNPGPPPEPGPAVAGTIASEPVSVESQSSPSGSSEPSESLASSSSPTGSASPGGSTTRGATASQPGLSETSRVSAPAEGSSVAPSKPSGSAGSSSSGGTRSIPTPKNTVVVPSFGAAVKGPLLKPSPPVSISIPAINVNASPTQKLGLLPDGSIQVPPLEDTKASGWYTGSPAPGVQGPSVILGHVDSAKNGPSVFYSLGKLKPGDEVAVNRQDGSVAVFKIDGVREYAKNQFPTEVVYGNLDHAGLRLITCGGTFDPRSGHYESNIVAFASLVSAR
jgi:hypothetical protein